MSNSHILTISGERFDYLNVEKNNIIRSDIAYALSHQNRYLGHSERQITVAEHTVRVTQLLQDRGASRKVQALGALHDAAEAYVGDMPSPLKAIMPEFAVYEERVLSHILSTQGINYVSLDEWKQVKDADIDVLWTETRIPYYSSDFRVTLLQLFNDLLPYTKENNERTTY